jgi:hypothetical protein
MVMLWKDTHLQSFLSSAQYLFQLSNGLIVKVKDIEDYGETNQTLRKLLSIPTLNHSTLDNFMTRNKMSEAQVKSIKAMRSTVNVKFAKSHLFWDEPEAIAKYGNHALTYKLLAERHQAGKRESRVKTKEKTANTTVTDLLNKEKVESNQIARNKRKRAVEIAGKEEDSVEEEI